MTKTCSICEQDKDITDFHRKRPGDKPGSWDHRCKECVSNYKRSLYANGLGERMKTNPILKAYQRGVSRRTMGRRRAHKRDAFIENVDALVVLEHDDGICGICDQDVDPMDFHVDHIIPLSRGGEHSYANSQVAHPLCNRRKGSNMNYTTIPQGAN